MATVSLTSNLKLRLSSDLTADARSNLLKLDNLASLYQINSNEQALIRSKTDIIFQPESPDIGGSGSGGSISVGTIDQPAQSILLSATNINLSGTLTSTSAIISSSSIGLKSTVTEKTVTLAPPVNIPADYTLIFPETDGSANQVLQTDGSGNLGWATLTGLNIGQELAVLWSPANGATKTIVHNFASYNTMVQILDSGNNYQNIDIDNIERPDNNTIVLSASSAPSLNNYIVLIKQIT